MKRHKKLQQFALDIGCELVPISYNNFGKKIKGYDIVKQINGSNYIQISLEPVHYSNGDRWLITNYVESELAGLHYAKKSSELAVKFAALQPAKTHMILKR